MGNCGSSPTGGGAPPKGKGVDFDAVRADLKAMMLDDSWDDGTYAPLFIRLAWHSSGTYTKHDEKPKGGSNGATMRFQLEKDDPENVGLDHAVKLLEPIAKKHPGLTTSDLWILAAYVSLETTEGPVIEFTPGRKDKTASDAVAPGRLPDAQFGIDVKKGVDSQGRAVGWEKLAKHVRDVFTRMGFADQEVVALLCGGHVYGRCHPNLSGFAGAWVEEPTVFSNEYAADMVDDEWMYVAHDTRVAGELVPEETRPAPGRVQYMTKWSPANRIENRGSSQYPPGRYKVVAEDWINVRRSHLVDSDVIDKPQQGTEFNVLSTREFGAGVRGQLDVGGWVSIVNSAGDEQLMERIGDLEVVPAKYRILPEVTKYAHLYDNAPTTPEEVISERTGTLSSKEVELSEFAFVAGANDLSDIFGKIKNGSGWVCVVLSECGAVFERIEKGYNETPRKSVGPKLEVKYQMMLPSDMVLLWDDGFRKHLEVYAKDEEKLKEDFGIAYKKLTELGVPGCPAMGK